MCRAWCCDIQPSSEVLLWHHLQDAVGDRVSLRMADGRALRIALPARPAEPLPALALDALAAVLEPATWHALRCRHITSPGSPPSNGIQ